MKSRIQIVCLVASLGTASALGQIPPPQTSASTTATSSPVAFVYVSRTNNIDGFSVSSSGKLTPVPGSPFPFTGYGKLSVSKHFLFGMAGDGSKVTSFSIASNGSIKKVDSLNAWKYEPGEGPFCPDNADMQIDTTGTTLYVQENPNCAGNPNQGYLSVHIESNGYLQYIGSSGGSIDDFGQGDTISLAMAGTNQYAFDGWCGEDNNNLSAVDIYKRESNGLLQYIGQDNTPPNDYFPQGFCAGQVAADSQNHLAVAFQRLDSEGGDNGPWNGPYFLASYTEDSHGNLTTTSTSDNMPEESVSAQDDLTTMSISPSNKLLAVGGISGFQVFHFNGANPITKYSKVLLPNVTVSKFGWDKANHLFVFSGGTLWVYTVTSSSITQAPGSPYTIQSSNNLIVRDLQ